MLQARFRKPLPKRPHHLCSNTPAPTTSSSKWCHPIDWPACLQSAGQCSPWKPLTILRCCASFLSSLPATLEASSQVPKVAWHQGNFEVDHHLASPPSRTGALEGWHPGQRQEASFWATTMLPASCRPTHLAKEAAQTPHPSALNQAFGYSECTAISGQRTESLSLESIHRWTCSSLWLICPTISGWLDGPSTGNHKKLFQVLKVAPSRRLFSRKEEAKKSTKFRKPECSWHFGRIPDPKLPFPVYVWCSFTWHHDEIYPEMFESQRHNLFLEGNDLRLHLLVLVQHLN